MPRKAGGARRKRRTHKLPTHDEGDQIPRSFVLRRGKVPNTINTLVSDLRQTLMPHTALNLRERKSNNLRDYLSVAGKLGISHLWLLSATARAPYLRIASVPSGPTLSFRIVQYCLGVDVRAIKKRGYVFGERDFEMPPLLVLNDMKAEGKEGKIVEIIRETFRHSFPPLDVGKLNLGAMRRVLLVQRDTEKGCFYLRHYVIKIVPAGLSKPVRKLIRKRRVPKLGRLGDVAEVMEGGAGVWSSDSEVEMGDMGKVTLPQGVKGMKTGSKSRVKLEEVGPRLTLELVKIVSGVCEGETLYHRMVEKSKEEAEEDRKRVDKKKALKRKRREEQEENVRKKNDVKKAKKERHKRNIESRLKAEKEAKEQHQEEAKEQHQEEAKERQQEEDGEHSDQEVSDTAQGESSGSDADGENSD